MLLTTDSGSGLIKPETQPNFPECDLTAGNTQMLSEFILQNEAGVSAIVRDNTEYQQGLAGLLLKTDILDGKALDPNEYKAFREGFASMEYITLLISARLYNGFVAVRQTQRRLIGQNYTAKFELGRRTDSWIDARPNVFEVMSTESIRRSESMAELSARLVGAQIACELQLPVAA